MSKPCPPAIRALQVRYDNIEKKIERLEKLVDKLRDTLDELDIAMTTILESQSK